MLCCLLKPIQVIGEGAIVKYIPIVSITSCMGAPNVSEHLCLRFFCHKFLEKAPKFKIYQ